MDNAYKIINCRTFMIEELPEPLTPASFHLQIFDNYIENTRIRIRKIRNPYEKKWSWILQKRFCANAKDLSVWSYAEMYLDEAEHKLFQQFNGLEIRKNRYFFDLDKTSIEIDVYLGNLLGLSLMNVSFESVDENNDFVPPTFARDEVTNSEFFKGEILVEKSFEDVRLEIEMLQKRQS